MREAGAKPFVGCRVVCLVLGLAALAAFGCAQVSPPKAGAPSTSFEKIRVGDSMIQVSMQPGMPLPKSVVMDWVRRVAGAVTGYLGRFPVKELRLVITPGGKEAVSHGLTLAGS